MLRRLLCAGSSSQMVAARRERIAPTSTSSTGTSVDAVGIAEGLRTPARTAR